MSFRGARPFPVGARDIRCGKCTLYIRMTVYEEETAVNAEEALSALAVQIAAAHALASRIMVDHHNEPRHLALLNMLCDMQDRVDALLPERSSNSRRAS